MRKVAALFVAKGGCYFGLRGVDPWPADRDARKYRGPWPVVAHPPCSRWCRLAGLVEARWGYKRGEDGGTFEAALRAVRRFGGVLEHPAYSDAWAAFDLPEPPRWGWQQGLCGGWSCHVEQGRYGHPAKKATWLYAFGVRDLPDLRWGSEPDVRSRALVSWCGNRVKSGEIRPRVGKDAAARTPPHVSGRTSQDCSPGSEVRLRPVEMLSWRQRNLTPEPFRDVLISIAQSAPPVQNCSHPRRWRDVMRSERLSKVTLTIEDTACGTTVTATKRYWRGKQGEDNSLAEAVLHDVVALLTGRPASEFLLKYGELKPAKLRLHVIIGGKG